LPEIEGKSPDDEYDPFKADVFSVGVCLLQSLKTMFQSLVQKFRNNELQVVMYSLRLRLSKIRHNKIIWLKTKTKSDKSYFDFEIKTKTKTNEISFYKIKTKTRETEL
jgi:hypothetical protein